MNNPTEQVTSIKAKLTSVSNEDIRDYGITTLVWLACAYALLCVVAVVKYVLFTD